MKKDSILSKGITPATFGVHALDVLSRHTFKGVFTEVAAVCFFSVDQQHWSFDADIYNKKLF